MITSGGARQNKPTENSRENKRKVERKMLMLVIWRIIKLKLDGGGSAAQSVAVKLK